VPDLSFERQRLYKMVDNWIDAQAEMEPGCDDPTHIPENVRVGTAVLVVGVNYELPQHDDKTYQTIFSHSESRDGWTVSGVLQGAADIARMAMVGG
jgi:hypothetical protein